MILLASPERIVLGGGVLQRKILYAHRARSQQPQGARRMGADAGALKSGFHARLQEWSSTTPPPPPATPEVVQHASDPSPLRYPMIRKNVQEMLNGYLAVPAVTEDLEIEKLKLQVSS